MYIVIHHKGAQSCDFGALFLFCSRLLVVCFCFWLLLLLLLFALNFLGTLHVVPPTVYFYTGHFLPEKFQNEIKCMPFLCWFVDLFI